MALHRLIMGVASGVSVNCRVGVSHEGYETTFGVDRAAI